MDNINVARVHVKYGTLRFAIASARIKWFHMIWILKSAGASELKLT